jgi:hypothetical protein
MSALFLLAGRGGGEKKAGGGWCSRSCGDSSIQEELLSGVLWQLPVITPDFKAVGLPLRSYSAPSVGSPACRRQVVRPQLPTAG